MTHKLLRIIDVNEKTLYYVQFENDKGNRVNINIAAKTFDKLSNLQNEELHNGGKLLDNGGTTDTASGNSQIPSHESASGGKGKR